MAPHRAGRRTGRVEQDRVELGRRLPFRQVGLNHLRFQPEPRQIGRQPRQPALRLVDGGDFRTGQRQLRRLAARCGAEVRDRQAGDVAQQPRRQARRRVLDPPGAFLEARHLRHRPAQPRQPHAPGRQHDAAEFVGPDLRIRFDGDVDRRLQPVHGEDRCGPFVAIGVAQALREPVGRIVIGLELGRQRPLLDPSEAPQHRIDQPAEARRARV